MLFTVRNIQGACGGEIRRRRIDVGLRGSIGFLVSFFFFFFSQKSLDDISVLFKTQLPPPALSTKGL